MNIEVFVAKSGKVAFTCDGEFHKPISQIVVNAATGEVRIIFQPDLEIMHLNCALSQELCKKIQNELFCAIGYFENGRLKACEYVRFMCR